MTFVSNDPSFWPLISFYRVSSYCIVASSIAVVYDWALTLGQEFDLVWHKHWSLVTVLYMGVRYIGLIYCGVQILLASMSVNLTDASCTILFMTEAWMSFVTDVMLGVVIVIRLHVMYRRSRKILISLVLIFSVVVISCGAIIAQNSTLYASEELVLFGSYQCVFSGNWVLLVVLTWVISIVWEVIALCLAAWIAIKHFRELPAGRTFGDCMMMLMKSHVLYFVSYTAVACSTIGELLSFASTISVGAEIYGGVSQISWVVQMFVLGPRLILSIRQYNAKVVTNSDEATAMTSIAFQRENTQFSTGNVV